MLRTADELISVQEKYNLGKDFDKVMISWASSKITKVWETCLPEWTTPGFLELIGEYGKINDLASKGLEIYFKQFDFKFTENLFPEFSISSVVTPSLFMVLSMVLSTELSAGLLLSIVLSNVLSMELLGVLSPVLSPVLSIGLSTGLSTELSTFSGF